MEYYFVKKVVLTAKNILWMPSFTISNVSSKKELEVCSWNYLQISEISNSFQMKKNFAAIESLSNYCIDLHNDFYIDFAANGSHLWISLDVTIILEKDCVIHGHNWYHMYNKNLKSIAVLLSLSIMLSFSTIRCLNCMHSQRAGHLNNFLKYPQPLNKYNYLTINIKFIVKQLLGIWVLGLFGPVCKVRLKLTHG